MNRFPQEALFDRLASVGALGIELMSPLAAAIADFHKSAERRSDHGGKAGMSWVIEGNAAGFAEFGRACLDPSAAYRVTDDAASRARSPRGDARTPAPIRLRSAVSRRSPFAQHRAVGRETDAVRRRRVQRRDFLHGRLLRSRVSPDGSLAAKTAAPCQHRVEPLPGRDGRLRRCLSPAAVSVLQGGCSRQDERDGGTTSARRATPQ